MAESCELHNQFKFLFPKATVFAVGDLTGKDTILKCFLCTQRVNLERKSNSRNIYIYYTSTIRRRE